jgi:RNA polymerase sigma factor (TIGR02999 family)
MDAESNNAAVTQDAILLDEVRTLLVRSSESSAAGLSALITLLQEDVRRIAHLSRISLRAGDTVSTTALVNELYLKLQQKPLADFTDKRHFLAISVRAMRQVLIDYARVRSAEKRGGGMAVESLADRAEAANDASEAQKMLDLNEALDRLEAIRPRHAQVVHLRYFAGLNDDEIAELLDLDASTVRRDWLKARAWLFDKLR